MSARGRGSFGDDVPMRYNICKYAYIANHSHILVLTAYET